MQGLIAQYCNEWDFPNQIPPRLSESAKNDCCSLYQRTSCTASDSESYIVYVSAFQQPAVLSLNMPPAAIPSPVYAHLFLQSKSVMTSTESPDDKEEARREAQPHCSKLQD